MTATTATGGEARELPAGRLARFEDDDAPDLGSLLSRRPPTGKTTPGNDGEAPKAPPPGPPPRTETADTAAPPKPPQSPSTRTNAPPAKTSTPARTAQRGNKPTPAPRHSEAKNRIRSSSVHIPAALVEKIVAERSLSGRSNGQIVIAAIEHAHPRLAQLIAPPQGSGGTLFQQRSSRVVRTVDGPLTALNVRLFEDDYDIIDRLVAQYGAFSRGHLITAALTNYLTD